jgi:hypothetical protein
MGFADYDRRRLLDTNTVPDGISNTNGDRYGYGCAHFNTDAFSNPNGHTQRNTRHHTDAHSGRYANTHSCWNPHTFGNAHARADGYSDASGASRQPLHSNVSSDR